MMMISNEKRIKDIVAESKRIKELKIDSLKLLDSYYADITSELIKAFYENKEREVSALRNFVLRCRRRNGRIF